MATTRTKTNGAGGLKWSTIAAFLGLFIPIVVQVVQVHDMRSGLVDHIKATVKTIDEIKADLKSHDVRIRENSNSIASLEPKPE